MTDKTETHNSDETERRYRKLIRSALHTAPSPMKEMPRRRVRKPKSKATSSAAQKT